jgi:ribosomal protein S18 acetylase RimI-like enzyme
MAVESRRDVSSPDDSSPIKLEGPCFHVHNPRKRAGLVSPPQLSDDDGSCLSSSEVQVVEVPAVPSKRQRQRQSRRRSFSATARAVRASLSIDKLLKLLNVVELETSGFENNCLWFSTQLATHELLPSQQHTNKARQASSQGRLHIHYECMRAWPSRDEDAKGPNESWWVGQSRSMLSRVYWQRDMMSEPHISALAQLLRCSIIVVDTRSPKLVITQYRPGYESPSSLTIGMARRARLHDPTCILVRLHASHFRGLLPVQQRTVQDASAIAAASIQERVQVTRYSMGLPRAKLRAAIDLFKRAVSKTCTPSDAEVLDAKERLRNEDTHITMLETSNGCVAMVAYEFTNEELVYLLDLYVDSRIRGLGIGTALESEATLAAQQQGVARMRLRVDVRNGYAYDWYHDILGYEEIDFDKNSNGVIMEKQVAKPPAAVTTTIERPAAGAAASGPNAAASDHTDGTAAAAETALDDTTTDGTATDGTDAATDASMTQAGTDAATDVSVTQADESAAAVARAAAATAEAAARAAEAAEAAAAAHPRDAIKKLFVQTARVRAAKAADDAAMSLRVLQDLQGRMDVGIRVNPILARSYGVSAARRRTIGGGASGGAAPGGPANGEGLA